MVVDVGAAPPELWGHVICGGRSILARGGGAAARVPLSDSGGSGAPSLFLAIGPEDWCKRRDGISAESALAPTATPAERLVAGVTDSARPIRRALCGRVRYEILVAEAADADP